MCNASLWTTFWEAVPKTYQFVIRPADQTTIPLPAQPSPAQPSPAQAPQHSNSPIVWSEHSFTITTNQS